MVTVLIFRIKSLYLFLEAVAKWLFIAIVVQSLVQLNRVDSSLSIFQLVLWTGFAFFNIFASKFIDDQPAWAITSHRFSAGKRHRFLKTWFIDALEFINEAIQGVIIFLAYWNQWASITSAVLLMICEVLMITLKIAFEKHVTPGGQESLFVKKLNVVCKTIECTFLVLEGAIIVYSLLYLALHENWKDYEYIIAFLISFLVFAEALKIIVKIIVIKTTRVKEKANYEQLI